MWTDTFGDPDALRAAFGGPPDRRYLPVPLLWWSGETLDEERLLWQVDRFADLGGGAWCVTGLAPYGLPWGRAPTTRAASPRSGSGFTGPSATEAGNAAPAS